MDEGKMLRIQNFLSKNGANLDTLSKSKLIQLEKIDDAIQTRLSKINEAKETLKNSIINVSVISSDTGISRKTFYNNDLLRLYVELYSLNDLEKNIRLIEYEKLKEKNDELLKQIHNFLLRDIETENLRHDNNMLSKEIENLENRNKSLEYAYEKIQYELSELKIKLAQGYGTVIPLNHEH